MIVTLLYTFGTPYIKSFNTQDPNAQENKYQLKYSFLFLTHGTHIKIHVSKTSFRNFLPVSSIIYVPPPLETLDICSIYPSRSASYQCYQQMRCFPMEAGRIPYCKCYLENQRYCAKTDHFYHLVS